MEIKKTKIEVWEIVLKGFDLFPNVSIAGVFCLVRQKGFIGWGEWYYLHDVLDKNKNGEYQLKTDSKKGVEKIIKKLKENAKN